jgi:hypothetical protein
MQASVNRTLSRLKNRRAGQAINTGIREPQQNV